MEFIIDLFEHEVGVTKPTDYYRLKSGVQIPIYEITSFHLLTQFVGFGKYMNRENGNVYMRGQGDLYRRPGETCDLLIPSVLRATGPSRKRISKYQEHLYKSASLCKNLKGLEKNKLQPLLQHYGIKTAWLDIVDNLWVALWFGLHTFDSIILDGHEHVHITEKQDNEYAYVLLILSDATNECSPGVFLGDNTRVTDLRKACQSIYLRPHAQHALMIRMNKEVAYDYSELIVGIAKIPVKNGFDWIGKNGLLSIQSLFPPTYYDYGFRDLLHEYKAINESKDFIQQFGSIQYISY